MVLADARVLLLVVVAIMGGMGLFVFAAGLRGAIHAVRLWRQRPVPIGELDRVSGRVLIVGNAERIDDTVEAPVTGTDCLAYTWRSEAVDMDHDPDGTSRTSYSQLDRGRDATRFRVSDYSGSVVVDPTGATFRLTEELIADPVRDPTNSRWVTHSTGRRTLYESRLDEGETVVILGTLTENADATIDVERLGVQFAGGGLYIADTTHDVAVRRATRDAAVAIVVGGLLLTGVGVLLGIVPL